MMPRHLVTGTSPPTRPNKSLSQRVEDLRFGRSGHISKRDRGAPCAGQQRPTQDSSRQPPKTTECAPGSSQMLPRSGVEFVPMRVHDTNPDRTYRRPLGGQRAETARTASQTGRRSLFRSLGAKSSVSMGEFETMRRSRTPVWAVSSIEGSNPSLSASPLDLQFSRCRRRPRPRRPSPFLATSKLIATRRLS